MVKMDSYEKKLQDMQKSAITDWIESATDAGVKDFDAIPFLDVIQELWEVAQKIRAKKIKIAKLPNPTEIITATKKKLCEDFNREIEEVLALLVEPPKEKVEK